MESGLNRGEGKDRRLIVETGEVNGLRKSQWKTIEKVLFSLASELELKEFHWMVQCVNEWFRGTQDVKSQGVTVNVGSWGEAEASCDNISDKEIFTAYGVTILSLKISRSLFRREESKRGEGRKDERKQMYT